MGQFESFKSEQELVGRIERLRAEGVHDNDITVFSKESLEGTSLNYTGVNFKNADGSAWDRFVSLFTSDEPEERALANLDLNDSEKQDYITSLQAGDILLHVNEVALGESDKMGSDEEEASRYDSNDNNVGGAAHEKQAVGEEDNPGVADTSAETESMGSTFSAGEKLDESDSGPTTRAELDRNYEAREVDSINELDDDEEQSGRIVDAEPNVEYGAGETGDPENKEFEGTMRAEDRESGTAEASGRVVDTEPNVEYGTGETGDPEDKEFEGTMRAEDRESGTAQASGRVVDTEPNVEYGAEAPADHEDKDFEGTMRAEDYGDNRDPAEDRINVADDKVDVSNYGYDDTENVDPIDEDDDDDIERKKAAMDQQYYSKKNDNTKNEPDRRNFNI